MYRRALFLGLIGAAVAPFTARASSKQCFEKNKDNVVWTVPEDITRIRVESWAKDGSEVIDTHFRVRPGQKFKISAVKNTNQS